MKNASLPFLVLTAVFVLASDVFTKYLCQRYLPAGVPVPVLPGFHLTYVLNPGAAFSLLTGLPAWLRAPFFTGITVAALVAVGFYFKSLPARGYWGELALGFIVGGALGNLWDRWRLGRVVDFIEIGKEGVYTWPVFNVADSAVCVGVGVLILLSLKKEEKA